MTTIPTSGPYAQMLQGFLGGLPVDQQQIFWTAFLQSNGLTANPATTDTAKLQLFSNFVNGVYTALAPENLGNIEKTRITLTIFDILIAMMKSMTNTQISSQQNLTFWASKQEQYTQMASQIPVYKGALPYGSNPPSGVKANADPTKYNLGYGDVTMADFIGSVVASYDPLKKEAKDVKITSADGKSIFELKVLPDFGPYIYPEGLVSMSYTNTANPAQLPFYVFQDLTGAHNLQEKIDVIKNIFTTYYSSFVGLAENPVAIPWGPSASNATTPATGSENVLYSYTGTDQNLQNVAARAQQVRQSHNTQLAATVDTISSKKSTIGDIVDAVQRTVDSSSQGRAQLVNMYQSTLKEMSNIISSLFK